MELALHLGIDLLSDGRFDVLELLRHPLDSVFSESDLRLVFEAVHQVNGGCIPRPHLRMAPHARKTLRLHGDYALSADEFVLGNRRLVHLGENPTHFRLRLILLDSVVSGEVLVWETNLGLVVEVI